MRRKRKGDNNSRQIHKNYKDSQLNGNDLRVLNLLLSGNQYSAIDLGKILNIPDPRSNIRYLRNVGYSISDYWTKGEYTRHKIYFIHKGI